MARQQKGKARQETPHSGQVGGQIQAIDPRTPLDRNRYEVLTKLASGTSHADVARYYGVHQSSVLKFARRHEREIEAKAARLVPRIELALEDYEIYHKVNRIAGLQRLADRIQELIDERGLIERTITVTESGEVVRERFAREMSAELRAVYHDAAEELAQLPRPTVEVSEHRTYVLNVITSGNSDTPPQLG